VVVVMASAADAWAKPRVVLAKIDGDTKGNVYEAVSSSIEDDLAIVGQREVKKAYTKLAIDDLSDDADVRKLEKAVSAKAVIVGSLDQKADGMALHLKVYVKPGKPRSFTVNFKSVTSEKFKKTVHDTLLDRLGDLGDDDAAAGDQVAQADPPVKKKKKKPAATDDTDASAPDPSADATDADTQPVKKKKKKVAVADPDADASASSDGAGDDDRVVAGVTVGDNKGHTANRDAVRVDVGPSFTGRQLSFNSRPFPQAPKPFTNTPVPGAHVDGELYPFAFGNPKSAAAGIGVGFAYDKTLALQLRTTDPSSGTTLTGNADQQYYDVDLRYRIVFGGKPTSPSLTLSVGYQDREFIVDAGAARMSFDIPDVRYKAIVPGAQVRIPFGRNVALYGGGAALLITDAGPIEEQTQYGQAKVIGLQADAGLDITIKDRFGIRLEGDYAQIGFAFVGNGTEAVDRDGDPTTIDVGGAADRYYGGSVTFSVMY
jgi:hypothetical protein